MLTLQFMPYDEIANLVSNKRISKVLNIVKETLQKHFLDQKRYKVKWNLLFTKGKWQSQSPLANIRYLPKGFNLPIRTMIYGNKVAIVDFNSKPFTTIIIENKDIAKSYKSHFKFLWKQAKK